jgi:hypothetical protein
MIAGRPALFILKYQRKITKGAVNPFRASGSSSGLHMHQDGEMPQERLRNTCNSRPISLTSSKVAASRITRIIFLAYRFNKSNRHKGGVELRGSFGSGWTG